jgi:hypothetical protein
MEYAECFKIVATEFNNQGDLLTIKTEFAKEGSEFKGWIDLMLGRDLNYSVGSLCVRGGWSSIEVNDELIIGYAMKDGWKFELINNIVDTISVDKCERFICDFGIRNAYKSFENNGIDVDFPNLGEDIGMKQLMFQILYDIIVLCDEIEEITTDDFELLFDGDMDDDDDDDDTDDNEEDDEIVPITDEAFALIGGGVAPCA